MTTNVYDYATGVLASDSRWSIETPSNSIIYVDDSGYDKVDVVGDTAYLFAGAVPVIHIWKMYLRSRQQGDKTLARPSMEGMAMLAVALKSGDVVHGYGQDIFPSEDGKILSSFAGTGAYSAHKCWLKNKSAITAVITATTQDRFSGLPHKYCSTRNLVDSDFSKCTDLRVLSSSFLDRGMVMKNPAASSPQALPVSIPLKDAAENDPEIKSYVDLLASGRIDSVKAPCDAMYNKPSKQDEADMDRALDLIFGG